MAEDEVFVCEPSELLVDDLVVIHRDLSLTDFVSLKKGGPPGTVNSPLELSCSRQLADVQKWDILFSDKSLFIISADVADILAREFSDDLAFVPCSIKTQDCSASEWSVMVVVSMFRIIDIENSQVSYIPDSQQLMGFKSLSLLNAKTPNVFRDPMFRSMVLVSSRFVDVVQSHGWKGCQFRPAKGYMR